MRTWKIGLLTALFAAAFSFPARAQHGGHHVAPASQPPSAEHGSAMTHAAMSGPMHGAVSDTLRGAPMAACVLPELGEALALTDEQLVKLETIRSGAMTQDDRMSAMEQASLDARAVLTSEQQSAFDALEPAVLHGAMMAHMHAGDAAINCPHMGAMMHLHGSGADVAPGESEETHQH